ncbi:MAG: hypothetical protein JNK05_03060 [Myxococcales bacterium]|nr:hypothetical protein [Myxococcales bacterium]
MHKLFHTLVVSGAALVQGCASTQVAAAQPVETARAERSPSVAATSPSAANAAASPTNTVSPPVEPRAATPAATPGSVQALVADARSCADVGWHTTKSAHMWIERAQTVTVEGHTYSCLPEEANRTPRCCRQDPAR